MPNVKTAARISTGFLNTVRDLLPGTPVQNNTGVVQYQGLLGQKYRFDRQSLGKRWSTSVSAVPTSDVEVQYVKNRPTMPVAPVRGVLAYWFNKATFEVTSDDTLGLDLAGVYMGIGAQDEYMFIAKVGEVAVRFKASTTKATPAVGNIALAISGNAGLADVAADATAQTYGTDTTNQKVGTLRTLVTTQIATVEIAILD